MTYLARLEAGAVQLVVGTEGLRGLVLHAVAHGGNE